MRKTIFILLAVLSFLSCKDEINVITSKQPGKIVGTVLPKESIATIQLLQGEIIATTTTSNGIFKLSNVSPGNYRLIIKADNFGKQEIEDIKVEDGEGNDIGTIKLSKYPYPLISTSPFDGEKNISVPARTIRFDFSEDISPASLENSFQIEPNAIINEFYISSKKRFYINTTLNFGTEYRVTIDTNVITEYGEQLEFPFSFTFNTANFMLDRVIYPSFSRYSNSPIELHFNGIVSETFEERISVEPSIPVEINKQENRSRYGNTRISILPTFGWKADTIFSIIVSQSLDEVNGATLEKDTTIIFTTPTLKITSTFPRNDQYYIDTTAYISIETNYLLDEGTINNAVSISPDVNFSITSNSLGRTYIRLYPDQLAPATKYTVTIDKSLTDYYGVPLNDNYSFSFTTRE